MVADFNGDGKPDLAVANIFSNNVSVLLGNGDGTFQAAVNYVAGTGPVSVTVGDFDGDGKPDLAVADSNNGTGGNVSVLLGNGDGTFQAALNYPPGSNLGSVTVGDFNGDGRMDPAVANFGSNNVSILLQAPVVSPSANSLSFVNQAVGTTSAAQSVTITNSGSAMLTISSIAKAGANPSDFALTSDPLPISLGPGAETTIQAYFAPSATGSRSASLSITDNAADSPQLINLSGTGIGTTTTVVTSSVNPSTVGQSVSFTATDGTTTLGTGTLNASGQATYMALARLQLEG